MDNEYKVEVILEGEIVTLKSTEPPEHMQKVANYIDRKLQAVKAKNLTAVIDDKMRTLMLSLNVANDYFKAKDELDTLKNVQSKFVSELTKLQKENAKLNEKLGSMETELEKNRNELEKTQNALNQTRSELEEFIKTFDEIEQQKSNIFQIPLKDRKAVN